MQKQIHLGCEPDGARFGKDDLSLDGVRLTEQTLLLCIIIGLAGAIGGAAKLDPLAEQRPDLFIIILIVILPDAEGEGIAIGGGGRPG